MIPANNKNPPKPKACCADSSEKDPNGGNNQYQTPRSIKTVATTEGPTPQNQAQKTTPGQTV
ncbi:MAG TPA: hypothetical protein VIH67_07245 [Candidatus Acidoferrum sp.]